VVCLKQVFLDTTKFGGTATECPRGYGPGPKLSLPAPVSLRADLFWY